MMLRWLRTAAVVAFVIVWVVMLRPQVLDGPAAWVLVSGNSMEPRLSNGDLVLAHRQDAYRAGDVVAFRIPEGETGAGVTVIHRIVDGSAERGFVMQGDNRERPDLWRPRPDQIDGRMLVSVPYAGDVLALARRPLVLAVLAALTTFLLVPAVGGAGRAVDGGAMSR